MRRFALLLVAAVLVASACSGDDDDATDRTTTSARATTTSSSSTTTSVAPTSTSSASSTTVPGDPCPVPAFGSVAPQTSPVPSDVMVLTDVTVATRDCTDTVRFEFDSGASEPPGFRVDYQQGPFTQDGSGAPVSVTGGAFLVVRLEPATGFDFVNNREAYTGPDRLAATGGAFATEVVRTGDFESVTTWVIGLREQVPFSVDARGAPDHRLTVTIG